MKHQRLITASSPVTIFTNHCSRWTAYRCHLSAASGCDSTHTKVFKLRPIVQGLQLPPKDVQHFTVVRQNDELHFTWAATEQIDIDHYVYLKKKTVGKCRLRLVPLSKITMNAVSASGTYLIKAVSITGKEIIACKSRDGSVF